MSKIEKGSKLDSAKKRANNVHNQHFLGMKEEWKTCSRKAGGTISPNFVHCIVRLLKTKWPSVKRIHKTNKYYQILLGNLISLKPGGSTLAESWRPPSELSPARSVSTLPGQGTFPGDPAFFEALQWILHLVTLSPVVDGGGHGGDVINSVAWQVGHGTELVFAIPLALSLHRSNDRSCEFFFFSGMKLCHSCFRAVLDDSTIPGVGAWKCT